ncbi:MAG: hypothetical protein MJZ19_01830 [Paludibacteraceae bacterium]|nr:hypothetical protein [Paludibacteraceae bacterium]
MTVQDILNNDFMLYGLVILLLGLSTVMALKFTKIKNEQAKKFMITQAGLSLLIGTGLLVAGLLQQQ